MSITPDSTVALRSMIAACATHLAQHQITADCDIADCSLRYRYLTRSQLDRFSLGRLIAAQ